MGSGPGGELSRWGVVLRLVGNGPSGEKSWWGMVLVGVVLLWSGPTTVFALFYWRMGMAEKSL